MMACPFWLTDLITTLGAPVAVVVDEEGVVCAPQFAPLYTAAIVVGPVIVIAAGSAVLPPMLPPDQWLNVHEP